MTTPETLRKLRDEIREKAEKEKSRGFGWVNSGRVDAHYDDADLIDAEIKRLEKLEQKP